MNYELKSKHANQTTGAHVKYFAISIREMVVSADRNFFSSVSPPSYFRNESDQLTGQSLGDPIAKFVHPGDYYLAHFRS